MADASLGFRAADGGFWSDVAIGLIDGDLEGVAGEPETYPVAELSRGHLSIVREK